MYPKQLRIDFPDYSAKEQEKDAMKSCFKQVYLIKVYNEWANFTIIDGKDDFDFYDKSDLTETYFTIKSKFPQHQVRVIQNEGLQNYLRDQRERLNHQKSDLNKLQMMLDFNNGKGRK